MCDSTWSQLCCLAFLIFGTTWGNDPFEGNFPTLHCVPELKHVLGCNGSLVDAYEKTEASKSDQNGNRADTYAFLFTRRNKQCAEYLHRCDGRLPNDTYYNEKKKTVLVVGGYISTVCGLAYLREFKDQLLFRDDYNVILIDWPWGNYPDIYSAMRNAEVVGKQTAFLIKNIMNQKGISEDMFHIIGHSIGAHIAGFAGRYFSEFCPGKLIRRITGLDPAGTVYTHADPKDRLDPSDAKLVDVIHTSAKDCLLKGIGTVTPSGHADFYVNGGYWQKSCFKNIMYAYMKCDFLYATGSLFPPLCFHFEAVQYFKVSINPCRCQFIGVICDNYHDFQSGKCRQCGADGSRCAVMGMDWEYYPRKYGNFVYYLDTTWHCPYCDNSKLELQGFPSSAVPEGQTRHCFEPSSNITSENCSPAM